jgi:hypothetical protein
VPSKHPAPQQERQEAIKRGPHSTQSVAGGNSLPALQTPARKCFPSLPARAYTSVLGRQEQTFCLLALPVQTTWRPIRRRRSGRPPQTCDRHRSHASRVRNRTRLWPAPTTRSSSALSALRSKDCKDILGHVRRCDPGTEPLRATGSLCVLPCAYSGSDRTTP